MGISDVKHIIKRFKNGEKLTDKEKKILVKAAESNVKLPENRSLLHIFSKISQALIKTDDFEKMLEDIFSVIGPELDVDRVYYFENHLDPETKLTSMTQKVEWTSDRATPQIDNENLISVPFDRYPALLQPLSSGENYNRVVKNVKEKELRKLFESQDIKSILNVPIFIKNNFVGHIGLDDCHSEREWSNEVEFMLETLAVNIAQVIEKQEIRQVLDDTYRQARIGTWEMDVDTDEFSWSPITKEIFEIEENEPLTRDIVEKAFIHGDDKDKILKAVEESLQDGTPYDFEVEIRTLKGNKKWVRDTGKAQFKDGKPVRIHGTVQDITDRKSAEKESEESKKLLEAITEQTDVSILVRSEDGEHLFVNRKWKETFGLENVDVIGKTVHELFDEREAGFISQKDMSILKNGRAEQYEERVKTVEGYRYFMVNKFPLKNVYGNERAIGGIGTDITELKNTQEKLETAEQKFRNVVEYSTNLFYTHDVNHELTYLSPQSKKFFGFEPEEAKRRWTEFVTDNPINEAGFNSTVKAIETGEPQPSYQLQLKKGNGEIVWVEVNEAPVVKDGKTVGITGSLTDITERKQVQEEIKKSLKEKETLLAEIHHRVKNNLAVVASMMQMQAHVTTDERLSQSLLESVMRIKSMANIHEYLYKSQHFANLDFSENLESIVTNVIGAMQFELKIDTKFNCNSVMLNVNQAIPCSLIVNEVITNILKHAFKGRSEGRVSVELSEVKDQVQLKISDDGVGMPVGFDPEKIETLGMMLIKTLSEQLDGEFNYFSPDKGTTFSLSFKKESVDQPV